MSKRAARATSPNGEKNEKKRLHTEQQRTLGAPRFHNSLGRYETKGGLIVDCEAVC